MTGREAAVEALVRVLVENRDRDYAASVYKFTPDRMAATILAAIERGDIPDQEEWKPRTGTVEDDLRSRLGCVMEATYWDRPYEERIAAIQGMCDLTTDGMTAADQEEADRG